MNRGISRRSILGLLASTALPWRAKAASIWSASRIDVSCVAEQLLKVLPHRESAAVVGRRYLNVTPSVADVYLLTTEIAQGTQLGIVELGTLRSTELMSLLREKIRRDFRNQKISVVDGWLLSVTEVQLCALASLVKETRSRALSEN